MPPPFFHLGGTMDKQSLEEEYSRFIQTDEGKEWLEEWEQIMGAGYKADLGDYVYDFHPERLCL